MIYGIVACSDEALLPAPLPPLVAPQRAFFDFVNNTYQWDSSILTASQTIGSPELLGQNGLQLTGSESAGAEIIYAPVKSFLGACQFTVVFEIETLEDSNQTVLWIGSSGGAYFIMLEFYLNYFDLSDQDNAGSRLAQDENATSFGTIRVAATRIDYQLSVSVAGNPVSLGGPDSTLPVGGSPMINFYLGGFPGSVADAINIHWMKIYDAVGDTDLPALSEASNQLNASFLGTGNLSVYSNLIERSSAIFSGSGLLSADGYLRNPLNPSSALFSGSGGLNIQTIRLGPFVPTDLASLVGWWDAADTATLTDAGSGHCSQWDDKSANGNHVIQGTDGNRPVITPRGINNLTTLTFTSTSSQVLQKLTCSGLPTLATGICFGVVVWSTNTSDHGVWDISDTTATNRTALLAQFAGTGLTLRSQNAQSSSKAFTDTTAPHIFSGSISTTLRDVYLDGTQGTSNAVTQSSLNSVNLRIGSLFTTQPMAGQIAEVVLLSGANSTERQKLEGYLAWKWGTVALLPGGHPYISSPP